MPTVSGHVQAMVIDKMCHEDFGSVKGPTCRALFVVVVLAMAPKLPRVVFLQHEGGPRFIVLEDINIVELFDPLSQNVDLAEVELQDKGTVELGCL